MKKSSRTEDERFAAGAYGCIGMVLLLVGCCFVFDIGTTLIVFGVLSLLASLGIWFSK